MVTYIARRLLLLPVVLFGVSVLIFGCLSVYTPYERLAFYVNENILSHINSQNDWDVLVHRYGLDQPIYRQYASWLNNVLHGNLGYSVVASMPLSEAIAKYFPASLELALFAMIPVLVVAVKLGFVSAEHPNTLIDHALRGIAITGWSLPSFIAGMGLLLLFYGVVPWFPPGRVSVEFVPIIRSPGFIRYTNMMTLDALLNGQFGVFVDSLRHLVLPTITLSYLSWALLMRVTRSALLNELRQDYVTTARAKGLSEKTVCRHARRNSMISVVTMSGMMLAGMLSGVVITEMIFNLPGLGRLMARASLALDAVTVLGLALVNGSILVIANLVVDILYTFLDPRTWLD